MQPKTLASVTLPTLFALASFSLAAVAQPHRPARYVLTDLGDSRPFSQANTVNNDGFIAGLALTSQGTQHAVVWYRDHLFDINGAGLGGPDSGALAINEGLEVAGQTETGILDPNHENFCVYGTGFTCVPFAWRKGLLMRCHTIRRYSVAQVDDYIPAVLMRDLVGHDRHPAAFLVYLWLNVEQRRRGGAVKISYQEMAESVGISKSSAQSAAAWLVKRKLLTVSKETATSIPEYVAHHPWRKSA